MITRDGIITLEARALAALLRELIKLYFEGDGSEVSLCACETCSESTAVWLLARGVTVEPASDPNYHRSSLSVGEAGAPPSFDGEFHIPRPFGECPTCGGVVFEQHGSGKHAQLTGLSPDDFQYLLGSCPPPRVE